MNERDLFDESVLRRSLRLEEDERAPRVLLAGLAAAALLGGVAEGAAVLAPALAADLFEDAIRLAVPLSDGLALFALFVSPLTLVATVAAALLYVRFAERGADHVHAS